VTENGSHKYDDKKEVVEHHFGSCHCWFNSHAGLLMSNYIEMIYPQTMTGKLMENGVIIAEYKVEQCDKCSMLTKFDAFGYQKGYDRNEKVIWFCAGCR
jgi:hypothetical protein